MGMVMYLPRFLQSFAFTWCRSLYFSHIYMYAHIFALKININKSKYYIFKKFRVQIASFASNHMNLLTLSKRVAHFFLRQSHWKNKNLCRVTIYLSVSKLCTWNLHSYLWSYFEVTTVWSVVKYIWNIW